MTTTFQPELTFDPNVPDSELAEALHAHCRTTIRQVAALNELTEQIESAGLYEKSAPMRFNGPCFDQKHDGTRLTGQIVRMEPQPVKVRRMRRSLRRNPKTQSAARCEAR